MTTTLIYIHIGNTLPDYIHDSIYQTVLVSSNTKIYVLLDDTLITSFNETVNKFNNNIYMKNHVNNLIVCVPLSILKLPIEYTNLIDNLPEQIKTFRDSFWVYTIARFFYLQSFMKLFHINSAFHIENDIMIYENLNVLENCLNSDKLYMVKDSEAPPRVIASIMYLNKIELQKVLDYIIEQLKLNPNLNDMQLLGSYGLSRPYDEINVEYFPFDYNGLSRPNDNLKDMIFDGAAIGQFLGGIDPRNIQGYNSLNENERQLVNVNNPSKGFINETCTFKANEVKIFQRSLSVNDYIVPLNLYFTTNNSLAVKQIVNTHIHSKQLYQFSSVFNLNYSDIITGDRIITLCDFVITTNEIYNYHKNIEQFIKPDHIIKVQNFKNVNINALNGIFEEEISSRTENKQHIKLFIYTHILSDFVENILFRLSTKLTYTIYLHNSDHGLENDINFQKLLDCKHIEKVYTQNIDCNFDSEKFSLLPIGLANSMWGHGDTLSLYTTMKNSYYLNKTKNLYVNINPNTFAYRKNILEQVNNERFTISSGKPFKEYLKELSTHRFSLCVRGNGLDTHRFYESLYLGVIPVIINNKFTNMNNHVVYLKALGLPFYEINSESLDKYSDEFFNEELYKKIIQKCGSSIYNMEQLKLSYYS
jgi:hypothetical protein